ncbi:MAG: hypothetical protein KDD02_19865, partial [Phaeodactylibacter sp.]|nr:hypothetical protein [Phaeodactylibacter sp.]
MGFISIILWFLFTGLDGVLSAQNTPTDASKPPRPRLDLQLGQDLTRAEALLTSFKNDSASLILTPIIKALKEQGQLDTPFGIRAQLAEATALEQDQQDELAIQKLLRTGELSQEKQQWDVFAKACLVLANLYEKIGREKSCLQQLRLAQSDIETHQLDSIYPSFAVRISSYHRIFGDRDSSLFYAREVLRTAPKFSLLLEEAVGHMLMSMLTRDSSADRALAHYEAALKLYQQLEDYTGCSYTFSGISSLYYRNNQPLRALAYNDSVIAYSSKAIALGHERHPAIINAYRFRGALFRTLGQPDSAWYYLNKGYNMELDFIRSSTDKKVIEIDARYKDEKKARQIEAQALQIQFEREKRNWLSAISLIIFLLASTLAYFYLQLRKANRKTRKQADQLKNLDAAKSLFFANVSHELRTPLTLVLGPIHSLLKEAQLTEKQTRLLQMASQSGQQLQQLVNEILDLRKLEMGKMALNEQPTELAAFFRNYIAQFESLAHRKQIDFSLEVRVSNEVAANLDREKNRQILYNLLSNAFKFTPVGGRIAATLSLTEGLLQFEVADSGPGIHPDDLPHVFDRFFQASPKAHSQPPPKGEERLWDAPPTPSKGGENAPEAAYPPSFGGGRGEATGTGIGLALCYEYARLLGGKIEVESTLGEGAVFRVAFPVSLVSSFQSTGGSEQYSVSNPSARGKGEKQAFMPIGQGAKNEVSPGAAGEPKPSILVVEDNPELQDYIRLILSEKYEVVTAENGKAALGLLAPPVSPEGGMKAPDSARSTSIGGGWGEASQRISPPLGGQGGAQVELILSDLMMPVMDGYQLLE